jgi:hypothetical protein
LLQQRLLLSAVVCASSLAQAVNKPAATNKVATVWINFIVVVLMVRVCEYTAEAVLMIVARLHNPWRLQWQLDGESIPIGKTIKE